MTATLISVHRSVLWFVSAEFKKHPPALARDASPFDYLRRLIRKLRDRWLTAIDETAPKLAEYFAQACAKRVDADLKKILRDGGWTVNFQMTKAMQDVRAASIAENVALIKSIPSQYFDQVEQVISRAYANGYDLKRATDELQARFKVSRKRAKFIARDQSSKLNAQLSRARYQEAGITHALWKHSMAGKEPRRTHIEMDGEPFELAKGMYDPDPKVKAWVHPGELINCRCIARPLVPFGRAWENNNPMRSVRFVKPVREQKVRKGYP
jgi:SPP1 gp7 family putative phage head morphogenesis protein